MKGKGIGLLCVALVVIAILAFKHQQKAAMTLRQDEAAKLASLDPSAAPAVILVANLREAEDRCACGEVIRAVRAAEKRGVRVLELMPESESDLLKRHRVLVAPTVLIMDRNGREVSRYEGEGKETLAALRSRLAQMAEADKKL